MHEALVDRCAGVYGAPSSASKSASAAGDNEWSAWQDRMIGVTIWNTVSPDGRSEVVVLIRDPRL